MTSSPFSSLQRYSFSFQFTVFLCLSYLGLLFSKTSSRQPPPEKPLFRFLASAVFDFVVLLQIRLHPSSFLGSGLVVDLISRYAPWGYSSWSGFFGGTGDLGIDHHSPSLHSTHYAPHFSFPLSRRDAFLLSLGCLKAGLRDFLLSQFRAPRFVACYLSLYVCRSQAKNVFSAPDQRHLSLSSPVFDPPHSIPPVCFPLAG